MSLRGSNFRSGRLRHRLRDLSTLILAYAKDVRRKLFSLRNTSFRLNMRFANCALNFVAFTINLLIILVPPLGLCDPCLHQNISGLSSARAWEVTAKDN